MPNNYDLIDEWKKSKSSFIQQLTRNVSEINEGYPSNWIHFLERLESIYESADLKRVIEIGCGAGALYHVTKTHFPHLKYIGYDYSDIAISVAIDQWGSHFKVKNYLDLEREDFNEGDILVANALMDVLPDGDDALGFLLSLGVKNIHLQRVRCTGKPSYSRVYNAYDIQTYEYYHNKEGLMDLFHSHDYNVKLDIYSENIYNILLTKGLI